MQPKLGTAKKTGATVLGRALQTNGGIVPPKERRSSSTWASGTTTRKRRRLKLLTKQQKGRITAEELEELEAYVQATTRCRF